MESTEKITLVYIGSRLHSDKLLHDWWIEVSAEQLDDGELPSEIENFRHDSYRNYNGKAVKKHMSGGVGSVYGVKQVKETTKIYADSAEYLGLWPNTDHRTIWQTEHRTAITTSDLEKKAKKESAEDNFAVLKPIRQKYARLVSQNQRAALLAQIIAFITGGE